MHISSSYAKILGETNFQPPEILEVGQKQKTETKKERAKVGNNNGQLRIAARPPEIAGTWERVPRHKSDLAGTFELFITYLLLNRVNPFKIASILSHQAHFRETTRA